MNPTHLALRDATAAAHDRVDAAFAGFDLADRASYAAFLAAHAEALLPIEDALDRVHAERVIADWPARRRGALLREDLAFLRPLPDPCPAAAPAVALDLASPAAIAGTLYVLEGARLGGKFLARAVPADFPRAFLDSDQPGEQWRKLLDQLGSILYEASSLQSATAAALRAFAAFERAAQRWHGVRIGGRGTI